MSKTAEIAGLVKEFGVKFNAVSRDVQELADIYFRACTISSRKASVMFEKAFGGILSPTDFEHLYMIGGHVVMPQAFGLRDSAFNLVAGMTQEAQKSLFEATSLVVVVRGREVRKPICECTRRQIELAFDKKNARVRFPDEISALAKARNERNQAASERYHKVYVKNGEVKTTGAVTITKTQFAKLLPQILSVEEAVAAYARGR